MLCAAEMIGTGEIEITEREDGPDFRAVSPTGDQNASLDLPSAMKAAFAARKKAAGLFAPMLARLRRSAKGEADAVLTREVAELRKAWSTIETVLSRLPQSISESLGDARRSLTRNLVALQRHGGMAADEKNRRIRADPISGLEESLPIHRQGRSQAF